MGDNVQSNTTSGEGLTQKVTSDSCTDVAGNSTVGVDSATFQVDKTPIPSTASANNSSYSSPITINYDATTDPADLSGLKKVELWAKGPGQSSYENVEQATAATGSFSYAVTQEGTYSFYTIAEDNAGNREVQPPSADAIVTFTQDSAAPSTTASANNSDNSTYLSGEWTNQNVTVSLSAADNAGGSGLKEIRYTTDGTDPQREQHALQRALHRLKHNHCQVPCIRQRGECRGRQDLRGQDRQDGSLDKLQRHPKHAHPLCQQPQAAHHHGKRQGYRQRRWLGRRRLPAYLGNE